jgi:SAM-dependent methyltransferase
MMAKESLWSLLISSIITELRTKHPHIDGEEPMRDLASRRSAADGSAPDRRYLPGMGLDWLLPLYDPFTRLIGIEPAHRTLAEQAELESAQRVLEIGCGTGNLSLLLKRMHPQLEVVGLDPDPKALARARRKARGAGLALQLDRGFADQLPYPTAASTAYCPR